MWFIDIIWSTGFWFWICLIYYREYLIIDYFDWIICFWKWFWMFLFNYFLIFGGWPPLYVWHLSDTVGEWMLLKTYLQLCALPSFGFESPVYEGYITFTCVCVCVCVSHSKVNWKKTFFVLKYESKSDSSL